MESYELRDRVDIQRRVMTEGGTGDPVVTWAVFVRDVPAKIESVSAREFIAGLLLASQITAKITIRWRGDIDATMRIKRRTFGATARTDEIYNIAGILPDDRRWLVMPCTLGVNDG